MTRFSFYLLLILGSLACQAAQGGEPIGRLFFTPAERSALDAGKSAGKSTPVAQGPRTVQLNGIVTRSDSQRTVWVNGKAYHDGSPDGIQIKTDPAAPGVAAIRAPGANARVKVGQQFDVNSGQVRDSFSRRAATAASAAVATDISASGLISMKKPRTAKDAVPTIDDKGKDTPTPAR